MEISEVNPDGNVYQLKDATARTEIAQLKAQKVYSTEEVDTGEKWIDGSTIYRKVITFLNPRGDWTAVDLSPYFTGGVSLIVDASKMNAVGSDGGKRGCDYYDSSSDFLQHLVYIPSGAQAPIFLLRSTIAYTTVNVVIDYTK